MTDNMLWRADTREVNDLERAFHDFTRTSLQLEGAYRELEGRVARLTHELADARRARLRELREKERLAARLQRLTERSARLDEMGEMAASLAHQLRTPLAAATLYASQLTAPTLAEDTRIRFASRLSERLQHLGHMVDDMLRFARGDVAVFSEFDAAELLTEVAATLEPQLTAAAAVKLHVDDRLLIRGDRDALAGALANLMTNALQASGDGAELEVGACKSEDGELVLSVSDRGPGVPPELRQRIFEPFFTTRGNGTGLGLAVVAAIARAHKGRVEVFAREGGGTSFELILPAPAPIALPSRRTTATATGACA